MTVGRVLVVAMVLVGASLAVQATITLKGNTVPEALDVARAMNPDPAFVISASWHSYGDGANNPGRTAGISDAVITPVFGMPVAPTFALLSTGPVSQAPGPQGPDDEDLQNQNDMGGGSHMGGNDVTVLQVELDTGTHNCLQFSLQFLSEEYPEYQTSQFNDGFIAELDAHTWSVDLLGNINAPDNFAVDMTGAIPQIVSVRSATMTAANGVGSKYDGATDILVAQTPIGPGSAHTLYLSIFDAGDSWYDSAVFLDNLRAITVPNAQQDCQPGADIRVPPTADFSWAPTKACLGDPVTFTDLSVPEPPATITNVEWDFGDGAPNPDYAGPPVATIAHTFPAEGMYAVTLTVTDSEDEVGQSTQDVFYGGCPIANFACTSLSNPYLRIKFQDLSFDFDGNLVAWDWDFGDGSTGTGAAPSHDYADETTYTVTLTVTDADGRSDATTQDCSTLLNRPPVIDPIPLQIVNEGEPVAFPVTASDPDGDEVTLGWIATGLPPSATFDPAVGAFRWNTQGGDAGVYTGHLFTATDGEFTVSATSVIIVMPATGGELQSTEDADADGIPDWADNCRHVPNPDQADADGDGVGDACLGLTASSLGPPPDDKDPGPSSPGRPDPLDTDKDTVPDIVDNCVLVINPDQADLDRDGLGDACDPDLDGDGRLQFAADGTLGDNCPYTPNPDQRDADGNGIGDVCDDGDMDGDGIPDTEDDCMFLRTTGACPTLPSDRTGPIASGPTAPSSALPWVLGGLGVLALLGVALTVFLVGRRGSPGAG